MKFWFPRWYVPLWLRLMHILLIQNEVESCTTRLCVNFPSQLKMNHCLDWCWDIKTKWETFKLYSFCTETNCTVVGGLYRVNIISPFRFICEFSSVDERWIRNINTWLEILVVDGGSTIPNWMRRAGIEPEILMKIRINKFANNCYC